MGLLEKERTTMDIKGLKELVSKGTILVDFYAEWCGPCKMMMPAVQELIEDGRTVIKVDIDKIPEVKVEYGIMSVPTFIMFKDGQPTKRVTGFQPKELLEDMFE